MSDVFSDYELGLARLLDQLGKEHPRYAEVLVYQQRLLENIRQTQRYGDTAERKAARSEVIDLLNQVALETTGISFTQIAEKARQEQGAPEQKSQKRRSPSRAAQRKAPAVTSSPRAKTLWGKSPFWARCLAFSLVWGLVWVVLVRRWDDLGCYYQQLPLEIQNTVLVILQNGTTILGGGGILSILLALLSNAITIKKERLEKNQTLVSILKVILVLWLLVIIPSGTLLVYFLSISGMQNGGYIYPKCAASASTLTPVPSATLLPALASTSTPSSPITFTSTSALTPLTSNLTQVPTQASLPAPTGTPSPIPAALLFSNMSNFMQACRGQSFGTGEASLTVLSCADPSRSDAVMLSWKVPVQGSFAGCSVSLPPGYPSTLGKNNALVFWLLAKGGEKFLVGFTSPDNPAGWKTVVDPASPGWHQEVIPLSSFVDQGADLAHLSELVISFEYELGEASRQGAFCIDGIGFASP